MEYLVKGLQGGQTYAVQVRSIAGTEVSEWSPILQITAQTDESVPRQITDLSGTIYGATFILKWTRPTRNTNGSRFTDFQDYQLTITSGTQTAYRYFTTTNVNYSLADNTDDFGSPQPNLSFTVAARDRVGNIGADSNLVALSNPAPAAPAKILSKSTPTGVRVSWAATTDIDFSFYEVYVGDSLSFTPDTSSFGNLKYSGRNNSVDIPLTPGAKYIKVCVVDNFGQRSAFSTTSNSAGNSTAGDDSALGNVLSDLGVNSYWKINELSGTDINDYGSFNNDGVALNGVGLGNEQIFPGNSFFSGSFDGSDDHVAIATTDYQSLTSWTIGAVVKPTDVTDTWIMTHAHSGSGAVRFALSIGAIPTVGASRFGGGFYNGASWQPVQGATTVVSGSEYFVVVTFDGTDLKLYVNGVLDGTATPGGGPGTSTGTSVYIGRPAGPSDTTQFFNGLIQDAFVLNYAVSATNVATMNSALASPSDTVANIVVKDEGVTVTGAVSALNFQGEGVTATAAGGEVTVAIEFGGGWTRTTTDITTASLTDGSTQNGSAPLAAGYNIYSVAVDRACRVRLYVDSSYRAADASRAIGTSPTGDHGVVMDLVFTAAGTLVMSPIVEGFILSGTDVPYAIENRSGSTAAVSVDLTYLRTE